MNEASGFVDPIHVEDTLYVQVHLLMSVYLTNKSLTSNKKTPTDSTYSSRLNQFLSTVHSMSRLNTASQDFYILIDDEFANEKNVVLSWLRTIFPQARIYNFRLQSFLEWKEAARRIPETSQMVFLQTNFDHPYIATKPEALDEFCEQLIKLGERVIGEITHWPEALANLAISWGGLQSNLQDSKIFIGKCKQTIGTCLVTKTLFHEWWEKDFTNNSIIIRPDNPFGPNVTFHEAVYAVPKIELFRHMDGYGHVYIASPWAQGFRPCCKVIDQTVRHAEWIYGTFDTSLASESVSIDLPNVPNSYQTNLSQSYERFFNLVLVASAHRINLRVINELKSHYLEPEFRLPSNFYIRLFKNKYWRARVPRLILDQTVGLFLFLIYKFFSSKRKLIKESILLSYIASLGWRRALPKLFKRLSWRFFSWIAQRLSTRLRRLLKVLIRFVRV